MRAERRESFRKWATLVVSTLALMVTCLRDPIVLTLKSTVKEVIRDEMNRYEIASGADVRPDKRRDADTELLRRLDHEVAAIRDLAARNGVEHNTWMQVNNCLVSIEAKLDLLTKEYPKNPKLQSGKNRL